jgi:microcystin-dependent protein
MSEPFIAEIKIFAGNFAPRGYAFCDGQLLPISQYTALFSLVGTIYGGDGRINFGLPNLLNRAPMHAGNGPGLTSRSLGESGGSASVNLTLANLAPHAHSVQGVQSSPSDTNSPENANFGQAPIYDFSTEDNLQSMSSEAIASAGNETPDPFENRQPFLEMKFIIALEGVYPSRS